jgi:hypothetical protein
MGHIQRTVALFVVVCGLVLVASPPQASAQVPVVVSTFQPAVPTVSFFPERRGLFGRRIVYRPVVTYAPAAPVTTFYAPAPAVVQSPVTTFFAPAPAVVQSPVTTFFAPAPAVVQSPVTTFFAPAPTVVQSPVTTFMAPPLFIY